jgi:UDP-glucose-4-epimerase GalE
MRNILVVGGAGYIGSFMCKYLSMNGYRPVVLDNLIFGHRQAVRWGDLFAGDMEDRNLLKHIFTTCRISAVMHFAAFAYVGESVQYPGEYYRNNVANTLTLLESMVEHGIDKFIFSSSCATYGKPAEMPITEETPQEPINPYGKSKLMVERILEDFRDAYGLQSVSLRYFNAAGADPDGEVGEDHNPETHLIPLVLAVALGQRNAIEIFGNDYDTQDGSCIRDYIHIADLAHAHLLALERLLANAPGGVYNLGNGQGYSVMEVVEKARAITGEKIPVQWGRRRAGDPAVLVGSAERAIRELGWRQQYPDLSSILHTAWNWHKHHPRGYR